jgi:cytosine/adenosine deaminase-related metal-dependent hydrolase
MKTGCTLVSDDHYMFPSRAGKELVDAQIRAAGELGVRFHPVRGAVSTSTNEARGQVYVPEICQTADEILKDCERLANRYHDPSPCSMIRVGIGPVWPYSSSDGLMQEMASLARKHGLRLHTHLSESPVEDAWCQEAHGMRPLHWMEALDWVGPDVWYAHGIYLNEEEIRRMGEHGTGLAHCPVSNAISGRIAPISRFLECGVPVGLGVDGGAGFGDMMAEIQTATVLHTYRGSHDGDFAPLGQIARQMLQLATRGGAQVLGWEEAGCLAPGKAADITLVKTQQLDYAGCISDPLTSLALFGANHMVDTVLVNGEVVVEAGRLTRIDEAAVISRAGELSRAFVKRLSG